MTMGTATIMKKKAMFTGQVAGMTMMTRMTTPIPRVGVVRDFASSFYWIPAV